jgi:hypothetical protein
MSCYSKLISCFLLVLGLLLSDIAKAQITNDSTVFIRALKKAPYLFEGTMVKYEAVYIDHICRGKCLIRLHQVFKGDIKDSFVTLITFAQPHECEKDKKYWIDIDDVGDVVGPGDTGKIFFFAADTTGYKPIPITDHRAFSTGLFCRYYSATSVSFSVTNLGDKGFPSLSSFYSYVEHLPGVKRHDLDTVRFQAFPTDCVLQVLSSLRRPGYNQRQEFRDNDPKIIKSLVDVRDFAMYGVGTDGFGRNNLKEENAYVLGLLRNFEDLVRDINTNDSLFNGFQYVSEIRPLFNFNGLGRYEYSVFLADIAISNPGKVEKYLYTLDHKKRKQTIALADWTQTNMQTRKDFLKHIKRKLRKEIAPVVLRAQ